MTILGVQMLLHYAWTTDEFPDLQRYPAQRDTLSAFCALGLLRPKAPEEQLPGQSRFLLTERGRRQVNAIKATPIVPDEVHDQ